MIELCAVTKCDCDFGRLKDTNICSSAQYLWFTFSVQWKQQRNWKLFFFFVPLTEQKVVWIHHMDNQTLAETCRWKMTQEDLESFIPFNTRSLQCIETLTPPPKRVQVPDRRLDLRLCRDLNMQENSFAVLPQLIENWPSLWNKLNKTAYLWKGKEQEEGKHAFTGSSVIEKGRLTCSAGRETLL